MIPENVNAMCLLETETPSPLSSPHAEILIGGDFCPLRHYEAKLLRGEKIFADPLIGLFRGHDFALVNLEAPLCSASLPAMSRLGFGLRCDPGIAEELKALGISAVGLANNHILDFQEEGLFQTLEALEKFSIPYAGAGKNLEDAEKPLEVRCGPLRIGIWMLAEKELNCADRHRAGSSFFSPERNLPRIPELRAGCDFLIVYLHAGHEFTRIPSPRIRSACRALIDAGADLVIGHHPHMFQGVERYGNGWIAYSLGNLVFDSDYVAAYPGTDRGFLLSAAIAPHCVRELRIIPCKMTPAYLVESLNAEELRDFQCRMKNISAALKDDETHKKAWEQEVRYRWDTEYRQILRDISRNFFNPENLDYALRTGNLFTCPTHLEMFQEICRMHLEGKLSRTPEGVAVSAADPPTPLGTGNS